MTVSISASRPQGTLVQTSLGRCVTAETLATAAHDMRGPLAVILGHLELLNHPRADHPVDVALEAIHRNAERMASTVATVLDGTQGSQPPRTRLRALCRGLAADISIAHPGRGVRVADGNDAAVPVERSVVERIVANLVTNAVIHTPADATVHLSIDPSLDLRTVSVLVRDDGPGIAAGLRGRVFERHVRGDTNATGTGLGLAISRDLARANGGDLILHDEPMRRGSCFELRLPLARDIRR